MTRIQKLMGFLLALAIVAAVGCAGTENRRSTGTYLDDKTISTKVKTELAADSVTQAINIEVETYNGVVQLSGFVDKERTIERAEEIARKVPGVKDVKNNLIVR